MFDCTIIHELYFFTVVFFKNSSPSTCGNFMSRAINKSHANCQAVECMYYVVCNLFFLIKNRKTHETQTLNNIFDRSCNILHLPLLKYHVPWLCDCLLTVLFVCKLLFKMLFILSIIIYCSKKHIPVVIHRHSTTSRILIQILYMTNWVK